VDEKVANLNDHQRYDDVDKFRRRVEIFGITRLRVLQRLRSATTGSSSSACATLRGRSTAAGTTSKRSRASRVPERSEHHQRRAVARRRGNQRSAGSLQLAAARETTFGPRNVNIDVITLDVDKVVT
jgi:hypothetical protein